MTKKEALPIVEDNRSNFKPLPWRTVMKGTIAEGQVCPYCGKWGYDVEDYCRHCGKKVIPLFIPAIEPERNKGRWVRITQGAVPEKYMCPFCRRTIEDSGVENLLSVRFPFCHCGADMRGGDE